MSKNFIAFALFVVFWLGFLFFSGTITSGYHFTDDHEIITINKNLDENGLFKATKLILKNDLNLRFRPFYYIHRALLTTLFGVDFVQWALYQCLLAVFTSYFLFSFIYRQAFKYSHAILFSFLTLIGPQSAIWWKLGPAEALGMFLLSAALFALVNFFNKGSGYLLVVSLSMIVLSSLTKESFTLFIPAYILFLLYLNRHSTKNVVSLRASKAIIVVSFLIAVLFIECFIIVFYVGTNKIGYAGIDTSFNVLNFLKFSIMHLWHNKYIYVIIFGVFILLQSIETGKANFLVKKCRYFIYVVGIMCLVIIPQFILYSKSGLEERYLLPLNFGFSFFIVSLLKRIYEERSIGIFTKRAFLFVVILTMCSFLIVDTIPAARAFQREGKVTNQFLSTIVSRTQDNDDILIVLDPYENFEWGFSLNHYLKITAKKSNLKFYTISGPLNNPFSSDLDKTFSSNFQNSKVDKLTQDHSCIAVLPFTNNTAFKNKLDSNHHYKRSDFDAFTVYTKRAKL